MRRALTRGVPETFSAALYGKSGRRPDVELARQQHAEYSAALGASGYDVTILPGDDHHPDCVFVEDGAVVIGEVAVATNPGAESRRGEVQPVAEALGNDFQMEWIVDPGTLDGGDVLVLGDTVYIGISNRTNQEGARQLGKVAREQGFRSIQVAVSDVLHLKSGVLAVNAETVVVTSGTVDERLFEGARVLYEHPDERHQFSCLILGQGRLLATASSPLTVESVAALGIDVDTIDISEILAVDGGLTCMSILYERP